MSTSAFPFLMRPRRVPDARDLLRRAWAFSRPLSFVGVAMLLALAATLVGILADPRVITGAPAWLKPAKFAISISIYCFTLLLLLTFVRGHPRLVRMAAWATAVALALEEVIIVAQVLRGTTSHFNVGTPLDGALWNVMGFLVVVAWAANLLTAVLLLIQRLPDRAFAWSLRLGVLVSFVGMGVAFLMAIPTAEQLAASEAGEVVAAAGAHSVGVEDGGSGLPVVGWSTEGGDLRAAHFFGLHALQVLPLLGWLLSAFGPGRVRSGHRTALVWVAGLWYLGFVLLLTWQARRGQSVVAPDGLTLGALAALVVATAVASLSVLADAGRARAGHG